MYLIIGGNGYLGRYIIESIIHNTEDSIIATARNTEGLENDERLRWMRCDIQNTDDMRALFAESRKEEKVKVVFLAAYHQPDLVAKNPTLAWDINVTTLARLLNEMDFIEDLYYASTDSVYGNSIDGYHFTEKDVLKPVNVYGRQKCAAEALVVYSTYHVVRYPFLIGHSLVPGRPHFYDRIVDDLRAGNKVEMFEDSYRSSMHFKDAADYMIRLCERGHDNVPGIVNVCGDDDLSKYDVGLSIARHLGVSEELIIPLKLAGDNGIFQTPRASSTLMSNRLLKEVLGIKENIKLTL